jgi:hypothetical protein
MTTFILVSDGFTNIKFPSAERALNWLQHNGHHCHYLIQSWSGGVFVTINQRELELMDLYCVS